MRTTFALLVAMLIAGTQAAYAAPAETLGPASAPIPAGATDGCVGDLLVDHNGTFENGYAWQGLGIDVPYYGAFGEAFAVQGPAVVSCLEIYLATEPGLYSGQTMDIYIWEGGITTAPGNILLVIPSVVPADLPYWPEIGVNQHEINLDVEGEITVGYWSDFNQGFGFYTLSDEDGLAGHPWTHIAPESGSPPGWHSPTVVPGWDGCKSLGFGIYVTDGGSPVESATWGSIKALFHK